MCVERGRTLDGVTLSFVPKVWNGTGQTGEVVTVKDSRIRASVGVVGDEEEFRGEFF